MDYLLEHPNLFDPSWKSFFHDPTTQSILSSILSPISKDEFPQIFRAFQTPLDQIKLVFLGLEPYPIPNYSNGLAFSVCQSAPIPDECLTLFKEIRRCFPRRQLHFHHGNLDRWANEEGIFLLNQALTVQPMNPQSHLARWAPFTDHVLRHIALKNSRCLFVLFGRQAAEKKTTILRRFKNRCLECPFPTAPGFGGSKIFQAIELQLEEELNWQI